MSDGGKLPLNRQKPQNRARLDGGQPSAVTSWVERVEARKKRGKLLLAAIDETSSSVFVPVNNFQSHWGRRKR